MEPMVAILRSGHWGSYVARASRLGPWSLALLTIALTAGPGRSDPKRIYIANDEHTDYFWTATGPQYRVAFQTMLDYYMDQADATAGNPADARGRFNCDGSLWAWEYQQSRSTADFQRL